jgi:hypothetical protein
LPVYGAADGVGVDRNPGMEYCSCLTGKRRNVHMAPGESMLPGAFCVGLCCGIEVGRRRRKERAAAGRNRRNEPAFFMLYLSSVEGKCRIGFIVTFIEFFPTLASVRSFYK